MVTPDEGLGKQDKEEGLSVGCARPFMVTVTRMSLACPVVCSLYQLGSTCGHVGNGYWKDVAWEK